MTKHHDHEHDEILKEVLKDAHKNPKPHHPAHRLIITNLIMVVLILLLLAWYVPAYAFPPQARPGNVPSLQEVLPQGMELGARPDTMDITEYISREQDIKLLASRIVSAACSENDPRCYTDALYYFVRDNINYVNDPIDEYYETPKETLLAASADCDGQAILLASLLQSVGVRTKFTYQPNHVVVEAWVPTRSLLSSKYTMEWLLLDPTCKKCRPGSQSNYQ